MKIIRIINDKEMVFELSKSELFEAFREQERKFYLEDIAYAIECFNDGDNNSIDINKVLNDKALCDEIIETYLEYTYENDSERWFSIMTQHVPKEYYSEGDK